LYKSLRGTIPPHFHGTYSIVAAPDIGKRQRVNIVVDNLRQLAKIPFRYVSMPSPLSSRILNTPPTSQCRHDKLVDKTSVETFRSESFTCLCRKACGGMIQVSVEDDNSHWLHVKGQKITVDVRHPDYNALKPSA
jgi:hypothetical protein